MTLSLSFPGPAFPFRDRLEVFCLGRFSNRYAVCARCWLGGFSDRVFVPGSR
jgi:hypothetical protein